MEKFMLPFCRMLEYANESKPLPYKVLFSLKDFNSNSDIVDKSGNNISVLNSSAINVGEDQYGTYMDFNGSSTQWLNFNSPIFDIGTNMQIYMKLSNWGYSANMYGTAFVDTRPLSTNGNYLITGYYSNKTAPASTTMNVALTESPESTLKLPTDVSVPITIKVNILSSGSFQYVNDVLYNSTSVTINMMNQNYTISRNAFYQTAGTPFLKARIYQFELRKLLVL